MNVRKLIQRRIRHQGGGVDLVGDVNAVIAANVNDRGSSHTSVSSRQRIVQQGGRTVVSEERSESREGG